MHFWAYMLHCRGGYFYAGHTDDLDRRIAEHMSGMVPGFASDHRPVKLVWSQAFDNRVEALEAERRIKGWSRAKKLALIRGDWGEISKLAKSKNSPSTSSGRTELVYLTCHPETPCAALERVSVRVTCHDDRHLQLVFTLTGAMEQVVLPGPVPIPVRTDGLWETTCCEAFVGRAGSPAYAEYNFAPSGNWAAYDFTAYRAGMQPGEDAAPSIATQASHDRFDMEVDMELPADADRLALSVVVEEVGGAKSYWALAFPPGKADFHHADCFALRLAAGEAS